VPSQRAPGVSQRRGSPLGSVMSKRSGVATVV
jgi:hypothetical protein